MLAVLGGLAAAALLLRASVCPLAAGLLVAAAERAASGLGLGLAIEGEPEVSLSGFAARRLSLRKVGDDSPLLSVDGVSGRAKLGVFPPRLRWSLQLSGARLRWSSLAAGPSSADAGHDGWSSAWPAALSVLQFDDTAIDLGSGRVLNVAGEIRRGDDGALVLEVSCADYREETGERAAERLSGLLRLTPVAGAATRVDLEIDAGSALVGSTLLDFAAAPLSAGAVVAPDRAGAVRVSQLTIRAGTLLRAAGSAVVADDASLRSVDLELASDDVESAFATLVRDPYGGIAPALAEATVQGTGRLTVRFDSGSRHEADATLVLKLSKLKTRSVEADAFDVELPWMGVRRMPVASRSGRARAERLVVLSIPWSGFDVALVATPGRLRSRETLDGKIFGGTMRVSDLVFEDDPGRGPRASADVRFEGFDLVEAGKAFAVEGLSGTARGDLGRVSLDAGALKAEGTIDVSVFGGKVGLSKLHVADPFGRVPTLGLDVTVSDVDLGGLTQALGLGRVSGVLEGRVSGLAIADGQPQAFDADLHTVSRKGVPQNVDVRAIVQLGVLGGADGGSITGTLLKMVDRYRYSALGLKARLRNDVFEIRGVRSERGRDYLVEGSLLPPSVSVVSHSQVVSFSEMLRRIQRIAAIGEGETPNADPP